MMDLNKLLRNKFVSPIFQGKLKVTGEEVHIKAEDSANAVCYLPQEVLVYLKLQKSEARFLFFRSHFITST